MKKTASLLPFALFHGGLNVLGPSAIYRSLDPKKRDSIMRAMQHPVNQLAKSRYKELNNWAKQEIAKLLRTTSLEEFDRLRKAMVEMEGVDPLDQQLYNGLTTIVDNFVSLYGGALSDADQERERIVIMTGLTLNVALRLKDEVEETMNVARKASAIHRVLLEFKDELAEDGLAPDGSVPEQSETPDKPKENGTSNDGSQGS